MIKLTLPLDKKTVENLKAGDSVLISGEILTARDCAHKRLCEMIERGEPLPFEIKDAIIYYAGPCTSTLAHRYLIWTTSQPSPTA